MDEEIARRYQEALGLLSIRNPGCSFYGEFLYGDYERAAFVLTCIGPGDKSKKLNFKEMENPTKALDYFIKTSQNMILI